ncbi:MAG: rhodanese-like domain-containing protein, partial [Candidatus Humimicrobiaceae bacterium]
MSIKIKNFNYRFFLKIFVFLFLIIFLLSSLFIYGFKSKQVTQEVIQIPVKKVYEIINSVQNYMISNVRAKEEFNKKHLQSAISVLLDELVNRLKELSNDKPIIIFASAAGKASIEVTKTGLEGNDQAKLRRYYLDDSTNKVYVDNSSQTVSNKSPKANGANLEFRTYYVEETFDGITNTYTYNVTNPIAIIPVDSTTKVEKIIQNSPKKGSITITKTGLEVSDKAYLSLYNTRGTDDTGDDVIVSTSPQLISNGGKAIWSNLPYGTYYVIEDFKDIKTNVYTYEAKSPLLITLDSANKTETFANTALEGSIEITNKNLLGGDQANLFLYYVNGSDRVNVLPSPQTVADGGKATWTGLAPGKTYYVEETFDGIVNTYTYNVTNPIA